MIEEKVAGGLAKLLKYLHNNYYPCIMHMAF